VQLVLNGAIDRHRDLSVILSHAGGFVPFAAYRFAELASAVRPGAPEPRVILESFKRFYFDTALSSGPSALLGLQAFVGAGRVLYGSDFPYAPAKVGASFTAKLDKSKP
jgi:6-methylsalicylate decarboxylase